MINKTVSLVLAFALALACTGCKVDVTLPTFMQKKPEPNTSVLPQASRSEKDGGSDSSKSEPTNPLQAELQQSTTDAEKLEKLMYEIKKNEDTVAWLEIPGTDINNSVLQYHNNTYYERRDERKKNDIYGCYFADYECSLGKREDFLTNTIIYGHSDLKDNPDGPRFSQLFRFIDPQFAKENRNIYLSTTWETMVFEIFAVFYTDVNFDYIRVDLSEADFSEIVNGAITKSLHNFQNAPKYGDKILTLSTCSVKNANDGTGRFVVMGKLLPK